MDRMRLRMFDVTVGDAERVVLVPVSLGLARTTTTYIYPSDVLLLCVCCMYVLPTTDTVYAGC